MRISRRKRWWPEGMEPEDWKDIIRALRKSGQAEAHEMGDVLHDALGESLDEGDTEEDFDDLAFGILDQFIDWANGVKKYLRQGLTVEQVMKRLENSNQTEAIAIASILVEADKDEAMSIADEFVAWAELAKKKADESGLA